MAQRAGRGQIVVGDAFVRGSIIGQLFKERTEAEAPVCSRPAIEGRSRRHGENAIVIDVRDPIARRVAVQ